MLRLDRFLETENRFLVSRARGRRQGKDCLMDMKFPFGMTK